MIIIESVTKGGTHLRKVTNEKVVLEEKVIDGEIYYMPCQLLNSEPICSKDISEDGKFCDVVCKEKVATPYEVQYKVQEFRGKPYAIKMVNKSPAEIILLTSMSRKFTSSSYGVMEWLGYQNFLGRLEFGDRYAKDIDPRGIVRGAYDFETDKELFPSAGIVNGELMCFEKGYIKFYLKNGREYAKYYFENGTLVAAYDFERKEIKVCDRFGKITMYHETFFD